jgi:hypothetical protein
MPTDVYVKEKPCLKGENTILKGNNLGCEWLDIFRNE